jgi:hypothetical protein
MYLTPSSIYVSNISIIGNRPHESKPGKVLYLPTTGKGHIPLELPFRLNISSITTTDLFDVHAYGKNSPHINLVCGNWASITPVIKDVENSATWRGLDYSFFVHEKTNLRYLSIYIYISPSI